MKHTSAQHETAPAGQNGGQQSVTCPVCNAPVWLITHDGKPAVGFHGDCKGGGAPVVAAPNEARLAAFGNAVLSALVSHYGDSSEVGGAVANLAIEMGLAEEFQDEDEDEQIRLLNPPAPAPQSVNVRMLEALRGLKICGGSGGTDAEDEARAALKEAEAQLVANGNGGAR